MSLRHQPPVYSPVSPAGIIAGARAALGSGDAARRLSERLASRFGAHTVRLYDCGTSALRRAMQLAAETRVKAIAVPAWACYDIVSAGLGAGVKIVFYDVDPATLQPREDSLKAAAAMGISGVVVVHAYGLPVDIAMVRRSAGPPVFVIEDAAQAWGGSSGGQPLGAFGDMSVFSFGRGKGITGGGGGALALRSDWIALMDPEMPESSGLDQVLTSAALMVLSRPEVYAVPASMPWLRLGETVYRSPHPPGPMSRASAALIAQSMDEADREAGRRRANADRLRAAVGASKALLNVAVPADASPGWLRLPVVAKDHTTARAAVEQGRELGVAAAYPQDLPSLAGTLSADFAAAGPLEGARELAATLITFPCHSRLGAGDLARLGRLASDLAH